MNYLGFMFSVNDVIICDCKIFIGFDDLFFSMILMSCFGAINLFAFNKFLLNFLFFDFVCVSGDVMIVVGDFVLFDLFIVIFLTTFLTSKFNVTRVGVFRVFRRGVISMGIGLFSVIV